ncbi:hypothetical protein M426DRAFT_319129 [Hypoxylon sp. CI-4A]|nr:hypothetical protein M426DRAFT_319129 [Hypoxylon sp. CI-4A]
MKMFYNFANLFIVTSLSFGSVATSAKLNVTAIGAQDGSSTLECWQLSNPFSSSGDPGTAGSAVAQLGTLSNLSYTVIPSSYDGGLHNAPYKQWVIFTAGLADITLPDDNSTHAYVSGGEFGVIFAADTADASTKGHRTEYPGVTETIALQIPTKDNTVPAHEVLHRGPCSQADTAGLHSIALGGSV